MARERAQPEERLRHNSVESLSAWRVIGEIVYAKNDRGEHTLIARDGWRRMVWELVFPLCVCGIVVAGSIVGGMASGIAAISVIGGIFALGMAMLIGHLYTVPNPMNGAAVVTFDAACARITLGLGQLVVIRKPVACLFEWIYFGAQSEAPGVHAARLVMEPEESPDDSIVMVWKHGLSRADIRAIESICCAAGIPVERARTSRKLKQHSPQSWAHELEHRQGYGRCLAKPYWNSARTKPRFGMPS